MGLFRKVNVLTPVKKQAVGMDYLPIGISRSDFFLHGYLLGNRVAKCKDLSIEHFDSIQFICYSQNPNERSVFFHALGWRKKGDTYTILVCRVKSDYL